MPYCCLPWGGPGERAKGTEDRMHLGEPSLQGGDGQRALVHRGHPENHGVLLWPWGPGPALEATGGLPGTQDPTHRVGTETLRARPRHTSALGPCGWRGPGTIRKSGPESSGGGYARGDAEAWLLEAAGPSTGDSSPVTRTHLGPLSPQDPEQGSTQNPEGRGRQGAPGPWPWHPCGPHCLLVAGALPSPHGQSAQITSHI